MTLVIYRNKQCSFPYYDLSSNKLKYPIPPSTSRTDRQRRTPGWWKRWTETFFQLSCCVLYWIKNSCFMNNNTSLLFNILTFFQLSCCVLWLKELFLFDTKQHFLLFDIGIFSSNLLRFIIERKLFWFWYKTTLFNGSIL